MYTLQQDLRYAFRRLTHKPGFTTVVILIFALGIAANTAIFSVVNSVLLAPLPYNDPNKLVVVKETNPSKTVERNSVSPGNFLDLNRERIFDSVTAFYETATTLQGSQDAEQVVTAQVSVDFFETLGVTPRAGPTVSARDQRRAIRIGTIHEWRTHGRHEQRSVETSLRLRCFDRWEEDHDQQLRLGSYRSDARRFQPSE
jgi:putative ABC transport system permease protein